MNIKYNVTRGDNPTQYTYDGNKVMFDDITLDFTVVPPGAVVTVEGLETDKVVRAKRDDNGTMWVELRQHHGKDAPHHERFPKWFNAETGEVVTDANPF